MNKPDTRMTVACRRLGLLHARYQLIERLRSPLSYLLGLGMPVLGFSFFIVPQRGWSENSTIATMAAVAFSVFGVMANSLFSIGIDIAQNREKAWGLYLRSLPGPSRARILGHILSSGTIALLSVIPVFIVASLTTTFTISPARWALTAVALALTAAPFMLMSAALGFLSSARTAVALMQVLMLGFAFAGGLFMPPTTFPEWLNRLSLLLPSRNALEVSSWAATGGDFPTLHAFLWLIWTLLMGGFSLAVALYDRLGLKG